MHTVVHEPMPYMSEEVSFADLMLLTIRIATSQALSVSAQQKKTSTFHQNLGDGTRRTRAYA